jgi:serine/threonine-protein kinase HipA
VKQVLGRQVMLVERFDRTTTPGQRRLMVSALTLLGLDENAARYATYPDLADVVRARFDHPDATLRELFGRLVFNVCISNTDDHARNHAAFWDGRRQTLALTPAYDLCPQLRSGDTAAQAMAITRDGRKDSRTGLCIEAAHVFHLARREAGSIIEHQVTTITEAWPTAAEAAGLSERDAVVLWRRQILNPAIHYSDY